MFFYTLWYIQKLLFLAKKEKGPSGPLPTWQSAIVALAHYRRRCGA